jgi:hypothetical protein
MRSVHVVLALWSLPFMGVGCTYEGSGRPPTVANARVEASPPPSEIQSETAWLREEVRSLRASLAERDQREAGLWRAYVELSQRLVQLQLTQQNAKAPDRESVIAPACPTPTPTLTPLVAATEPAPRKAVVRAINSSQLKVQQKRELIQSMRPARVIDVVNPWESID